MVTSAVNYWAVLVAGAVYWLLGTLWYSPTLFGDPWMSAIGKTKEQIKSETSFWKMIVALIASLIVAYGIARIMSCMSAITLTDGVLFGLLIGVCLLGPTVGLNVMFEGRPGKLFGINFLYNLVGLVIMGVIIGAWV